MPPRRHHRHAMRHAYNTCSQSKQCQKTLPSNCLREAHVPTLVLKMDYEHYDGKVTTAEPGVSMTALEEAIPSLTVATIIGVALVVLVAIAIVFVLGVLIDCRQQRLLDERMGKMKRDRSTRSRRVPAPESDSTGIVDHEEAPATSLPPADMLRDVP